MLFLPFKCSCVQVAIFLSDSGLRLQRLKMIYSDYVNRDSSFTIVVRTV